MVGAVNNASNLSDIQKFPYHVRVKVDTSYLSSYLAYSLRLLGWKNLSLVYTDDSWE